MHNHIPCVQTEPNDSAYISDTNCKCVACSICQQSQNTLRSVIWLYSLRLVLALPVLILILVLFHFCPPNGSHMGRVFSGIYVSVCQLFVFPHNISKTDAARITKVDVDMVQQFILGQKVKGRGQEAQKHCRCGSWHSCECWVLLVFCQLLFCVAH